MTSSEDVLTGKWHVIEKTVVTFVNGMPTRGQQFLIAMDDDEVGLLPQEAFSDEMVLRHLVDLHNASLKKRNRKPKPEPIDPDEARLREMLDADV